MIRFGALSRIRRIVLLTVSTFIFYQYVWKRYFSRTEVVPITNEPPTKFRQRIVAVGDLHGDFPHAVRVLRLAEVIDMRNKWIGKKTILVQTGDVVDRGRDTIVLYQLMDRLRVEAKAAGGAVVSLLGNHEYMNALGDWRYVTEDDIKTFGGKANRRKVMSSAGWIGQTWLTNYSVAARVPYGLDFPHLPEISELSTNPTSYFETIVLHSTDDPFLYAAAAFVHGGITPEYATIGITEINRVGHSFLERALQNVKANGGLPSGTPHDERMFYSEHGPLWERSYALEENEEAICQQIETVIKTLKVRRLIMGHTPQFKGILGRCTGKILLIDTGISSAYGGALSALEIQYTLTLDSKPNLDSLKQVWHESEVVYALQEGKTKDVLAQDTRVVEFPSAL
ncbi:hypothetical protein CROQUDRAFT_650800 [Cronartium quercuum f. sp. fusiforme G11]|uniref:Calcineurin-like phosphoesterase domain-containing protein n=1 Tax=Cronartium quercuum f. sp. fusiforme G11 TaxID=708437 RepID=A0A9P6TIG0_9BASI|nr:hypothetical protein CROQUDRAFT_650800 [Cronartium quercuum f. sp. fusiforme G11]